MVPIYHGIAKQMFMITYPSCPKIRTNRWDITNFLTSCFSYFFPEPSESQRTPVLSSLQYCRPSVLSNSCLSVCLPYITVPCTMVFVRPHNRDFRMCLLNVLRRYSYDFISYHGLFAPAVNALFTVSFILSSQTYGILTYCDKSYMICLYPQGTLRPHGPYQPIHITFSFF